MVSAIAFGVQDSFNTYVLSMVLCFLFFLALAGSTPQHIILIGKTTIGTVFLLTFFLAWGENALWLERPGVSHTIYFFSLGVAVFLLVAGYLLFQQWRQGKTRASTQPLPLFLIENTKTAEKSIGIIFFSVILGLATVLLSSLWPKTQSFYALYYFLFTSGNALWAILFFALYGLAFTFPLLMVWGIIFYVKRSIKLRNDLLGVISWLRICFSAIFIAVGFGLIYLFVIT
jgi:hypothetical protein